MEHRGTTRQARRCLLFCRASTQEATQRQMRLLEESVRLRGCTVAGCVMLPGASAKDRQTQQAIDDLIIRKRQHDDFDQLVVKTPNRLVRNATDGVYLLSVLAKVGIELVALDFPIRSDDPYPHLQLDPSSGPRAIKWSERAEEQHVLGQRE